MSVGLPGYFYLAFIVLLSWVAGAGYLLFRRQRGRAALLSVLSAALLSALTFGTIYGPIASRVFFPEDTEYAPGFNDKAFAAIRHGQSETFVTSLVGNPLSKSVSADGTMEIWAYSRPGRRFPNYWIAIVAIDRQHRVVSYAHTEFYSQ
jgi:hypothetical protein